MEEQQKSILGPIEKIVLLVFLVIISYILFKNEGCSAIERTEKVEFIEPPSNHQAYVEGQVKAKPAPDTKKVDDALHIIAERLGQGQPQWPAVAEQAMSKEENAYLQTLSEKYQVDDKIKSAGDWLYVLKSSHETYQQVKALFDRFDRTAARDETSADYGIIFRDEQQADAIYQELEAYFNLPQDQARTFARQEQWTVKDWAEFIELNARGERDR